MESKIEENKKKGFIKLYRSTFENVIFDDDITPFDNFHAWCDLISMTNHTDGKIMVRGKMLLIQHGQRFTSIRKLAARWHWSIHRVQRYIELLKNEKMIAVENLSCGTLVTIVKYDDYNAMPNTDGHTDGYTDGHTDGYTHGPQTIMNNNDYKNEKENTRAREPLFSAAGEELE